MSLHAYACGLFSPLYRYGVRTISSSSRTGDIPIVLAMLGVWSLRILSLSTEPFLLIACTGHIVTSRDVVPDTQGFQHMAEFINVTTTVGL